jgi:DNA-binding beta-propeller fold protein YncE
VASGRYLGTVTDIVGNPRHLVIGRDGEELFVSGNQSGLVGRYKVADIVKALRQAQGQRVAGPGGRVLAIGRGVRTIELSPDQRTLYAAVHLDSRLVRVDLDAWSVSESVDVDPFAVGLAVSPDGAYVVTTSQARETGGIGQSVVIYQAWPASSR